MTMDQRLQAFLASLPADGQLEFLGLCEAIYKIRFTGPTMIHWRNGLPKQIDMGQPIRLTICAGTSTDESGGT